MTNKPLFRYRVAVVRRHGDAVPADGELREHVYLHAPNAIAAQLLARAVTGAACALEPERLGEVPNQAEFNVAERCADASGLWLGSTGAVWA